MQISNRTIIAFETPREYNAAIRFGTEHPDWERLEDSRCIYFKKRSYFYTTIGEQDENN